MEKPEIGFNYLGRFEGREAGDWESAKEGGGGLGGGGDAELKVAHGLEVNVVTQNLAGGPELVAHWTWERKAVSEREVKQLAQEWFRVLELLVEHVEEPGAGGLTPSDLELVGLTQQEIDELEQTEIKH